MQQVKIIQNYMSATPAYGRDFKNGGEAKANFLSGADWLIHDHRGSSYASIKDFYSGVIVNLRYDKNRKVLPVKVPKTL